MRKAEQKELARLRNKGWQRRTLEEQRRLLTLSKRDRDERGVLDPIKPQEKHK